MESGPKRSSNRARMERNQRLGMHARKQQRRPLPTALFVKLFQRVQSRGVDRRHAPHPQDENPRRPFEACATCLSAGRQRRRTAAR